MTNLNASGAGSLRQCAEVESGARTCVFRVSGTISLGAYDMVVRNNFLTIAGQTAPGAGIALKDGGLTIMASHVIVRHLRVRPGLASWVQRGVNANGISVMSNGSIRSTDIIVDHCSISWTSDDSFNVVFGADRITFQWGLISDSVGPNDPRGKHFLMGYGARSVSFHHNLGAHGFIRWPEYSGGGTDADGAGKLDFVNNLHYNGNGTDSMVDPHHGPAFANFVGNYWQAGLDVVPANVYPSVKLYGNLPYSTQSGVYVHDNWGVYSTGPGTLGTGLAVPDSKIINQDGVGIAQPTVRYPYPLILTTDPVTARADVLARGGAFPRDSYDTRIVSEVTTGTGHRMTNANTQIGPWPVLAGGTAPLDTDHDGMPDAWELSRSLNPNDPSDGPADANGDGYTNLEDYLHNPMASVTTDTEDPLPPSNLRISSIFWFALSATAVPATLFQAVRPFRRRLHRSGNNMR